MRKIDKYILVFVVGILLGLLFINVGKAEPRDIVIISSCLYQSTCDANISTHRNSINWLSRYGLEARNIILLEGSADTIKKARKVMESYQFYYKDPLFILDPKFNNDGSITYGWGRSKKGDYISVVPFCEWKLKEWLRRVK